MSGRADILIANGRALFVRLRGSAEQRRLGLGHCRLPLAPGGIGASLYCAGCEPQRAGMCGARRPPGTLRWLGPQRVTAVAGPGCAGDLPVSAPLSVIPALGCSRRCRIDGARMEVAFTRCHGCQYRQPGSRPSGRRVRVRDAPAAPAPGGDAEPGPGCCTPPGVHLPLAPQLRHPLLCNSATSGAKQDRDGTWLRLHLQSGGFGAHSPARLTFSRLKKGNSPPIKRL